jgi:citrate lyase subunit beta/citryl-CoA lyase
MTDVFAALRADIATLQARHRARPERMHGQLVPYFRRGEMSIPAFKMPPGGGNPEVEGRTQSLKLMKKAAELPIDFFFYDLEDAAPDNADFKPFARQFVVDVLRSTDFGDRVVAFRPNNIRTPYFEEDVVKVVSEAGDRLQAMVIPKTEYADEVADISRIVRDVQRLSGRDNPIRLEILIESPRAFLEAEKIAAIDDVSALIFGAWDFARTIGGKVTADGWIHDQLTVRQMLPVLAAACGKEAVDAVTGTLPIRPKQPAGVDAATFARALKTPADQLDPAVVGESFIQQMRQRERALALARRDAWDSRACGYAAKWILHPDQIEPIHSAWTPSRDEALQSLKLTADYARAALGGSGAEVDGDRLADKAVIGTEWWVVRGALKAGVLSEGDVEATGFSLAQLMRTLVTHDGHSALG